MGKAAAIVLKDFAGAAGSYFGNARVPASIVMGSSLAALFALGNFSSSTAPARTPTELVLIKVYRLCAWASFILSLNTVITCTVASTIVLHARFDHFAETPYLLLKREFEYEFVTVRWSLSVCLLLFIAIVTIRFVLEFNLWQDSARRDTAKFVLLSAVGMTAHLISYINSTLYCWPNLFEMTIHLLRLIWTDVMEEPSLMRGFSLLCIGGSLYYGVKSASLGSNGKPKED